MDPLLCPTCGERMEAAAVILVDDEITRLLTHLGIPTDLPRTAPARSPPRTEDEDVQAHPELYPDVEPLPADGLAAA